MVIKACSPIVAEVAIIIEFAGKSFPPLTALSETFCNAVFKTRPFSRISSILNQGIEPFSQYSFTPFDGV